jgi:restriction endonuclease S subunit
VSLPISKDYEIFSGLAARTFKKLEQSVPRDNNVILLTPPIPRCTQCPLLEKVEFKDEKSFEIAKQKSEIDDKYRLRDKDIIVVLKGSQFRVFLLEKVDDTHFYSVNSNNAIIRAKHDNPFIDPEGLCFYLNTEHFYRSVIQKNKVGYNNITIKTLNKVEVPVPDNKDELNEIFNTTVSMMNKLLNLKESAERVSESSFLQAINKGGF